MPDVTLPDGREIAIDLTAFTLEEFRAMYSPRQKEKVSDETLARACQLPYDELVKLNYISYKMLIRAFFQKCAEPLKDPNSPSASSSP